MVIISLVEIDHGTELIPLSPEALRLDTISYRNTCTPVSICPAILILERNRPEHLHLNTLWRQKQLVKLRGTESLTADREYQKRSISDTLLACRDSDDRSALLATRFGE